MLPGSSSLVSFPPQFSILLVPLSLSLSSLHLLPVFYILPLTLPPSLPLSASHLLSVCPSASVTVPVFVFLFCSRIWQCGRNSGTRGPGLYPCRLPPVASIMPPNQVLPVPELPRMLKSGRRGQRAKGGVALEKIHIFQRL